jgi:hypothetical protein
LAAIDEEEEMAIARVVRFQGVTKERMEEQKRRMADEERPEGLPASEFIMLHDPESETSLAIVFFETEDDYQQADEILSAMPASDTPGQRTSVEKYDVVHRMTG